MAFSDADRELMDLQRSTLTTGAAAGLPSGAAVAADPDAITTWEQRRAAQREAYGQYVAAGPIHIGNALVFHTGQAVPLEHVIRFELDKLNLVNRVATPELARYGKTFDSDEEFLSANPHVTPGAVRAPEAHPAALDPRGGAAELDELRRSGRAPANAAPAVGVGGSEQEARIAAVADTLPDSPPEDGDDDKPKGSRRAGSAGKDK